jgi:hypothetical protein
LREARFLIRNLLSLGVALPLLLSLVSPSRAGEAVDSVAREALELTLRVNYAAAEARVLRGLPASSPAQPFYAGLVCLNRFLDLGDTTALRRAEAHWDRIPPQGDPPSAFRNADPGQVALYRGLAGIQLSYLASLQGQRVRPATLALAARRHLLGRPEPEAKATLMLYDHYRDQVLGKLPFVGSREFAAAEFRKLADASPLREMFLSSLFWIHVDRKRLGPALEIAQSFVERYPENRLGREMRADGFYRARRYAEARAEYEDLLREYAQLRKAPERLPLGYYRAVGNLARIYDAQGLRKESAARLAEWNRARRTASEPWLPGSLKRELSELDATP